MSKKANDRNRDRRKKITKRMRRGVRSRDGNHKIMGWVSDDWGDEEECGEEE